MPATIKVPGKAPNRADRPFDRFNVYCDPGHFHSFIVTVNSLGTGFMGQLSEEERLFIEAAIREKLEGLQAP